MTKTKLMLTIALIGILFMPIVMADGCEMKILDQKCVGNYVLVKTQNTDCSVRWKIGFFCPFGCAYGECLSEKTMPVVLVKEKYIITDENPLLVFSVKNIGTRGTVKLSVEGEASKWIEIPSEITLEANETKDVIGVVNVPEGLNGVYSFTIHAKGSLDYYAPSVIVLKSNQPISFTGTYRAASLYISFLFVMAIAVFLIYFTHLREPKEETFKSCK